MPRDYLYLESSTESPDNAQVCICPDCTEDIMSELVDTINRRLRKRGNLRPRRNQAPNSDVSSNVKSDKDKFQIDLDVQRFVPEEITIKTVDGYIIVEGTHDEKDDDGGNVSRDSRHFRRRFELPRSCDPETVQFRHSSDGMLSVRAYKHASRPKHGEKDDGAVVIAGSGPVRRKAQDTEEQNEDDAGEDEKSPHKKAKC